MSNKVIEFKPCPFCGVKWGVCYSEYFKRVFCKICFAMGPEFENYENAVDAWNDRKED